MSNAKTDPTPKKPNLGSNKSKKRKAEKEPRDMRKLKKFKLDSNPNLQESLIQRYVGNWKKQKTPAKYEQKFVNQYGSNFEWNSRAHVQVIYREGGRADLKVYTALTESGCGVKLNRHYGCWCKQEDDRQAKLEEEKVMADILAKKREAVKAMADRVNKKIHTKSTTGSRWGP